MTGDKQGEFSECGLFHPHLPKQLLQSSEQHSHVCVHVSVPKEFLINMLMLLQVHLLPLGCFRSYIFTRQSVAAAPLCLELKQTSLLLHDWLLQLVLSHREVFSVTTRVETGYCHSANHAQNGPHSLFCGPHFMGLSGSAPFINIHPCVCSMMHRQHPELPFSPIYGQSPVGPARVCGVRLKISQQNNELYPPLLLRSFPSGLTVGLQ